MGTRKTIMTVICICLFLCGCGHGPHCDSKKDSTDRASGGDGAFENQYYFTTNASMPIKLTHADAGKKKVYIRKANEALKHFFQVAHDTRERGDVPGTQTVGREANNYVKSYVDPILKDAEAAENLETRAEVAKLYLLTASVYYEIAGYYQAEYYLSRLTERFGEAFLLGITTDIIDAKVTTVAEGVVHLQKRISSKTS